MKPETILKKAIEKVVENGWSDINKKVRITNCECDDHCELIRIVPEGSNGTYSEGLLYLSKDFIFSHDFAKAFWGEGLLTWYICPNCNRRFFTETSSEFEHDDCNHRARKVGFESAWKLHLQQMVLEKDPIKYLGKFI